MSAKQFEWTQDANFVYISIPISGVSLNKIDVYITDLVLKVNVKANNFLKIFDFPHEVDFKSRENKISYDNGILEVSIRKSQPEQWDSLTAQNLSKDDIRKRREESFKRREDFETQLRSQREDAKLKFDRIATQEQMKLDNLERNTIDERRNLEKTKAEEDLYSGLDENARFKTNTKAISHDSESGMNKNKEKNLRDDDGLEDIVEEKRDAKTSSKPRKTDPTDIFDTDTVPYAEEGEAQPEVKKEEKPAVLADPRKAGSVQLKFTEKMYPHLAARESFHKEPPMPKTTQIKKGEKDQETENPIWLREKADEFYKNNDYLSAINAYSSAYKKNNDMIECVSNRSLCFLNLYDYENCLQDCNIILEHLDKQTEKTPKQQKLRLKTILRKGIALSWKGLLDEAKTLLEDQLKQLKEEDSQASEIKTIEEHIVLIEKRKELNTRKQKGDLELGKANIEEARKIYESILQEDPNHEIVRANLSLVLLKLKEYEQTVKNCNDVLNTVQQFKSTTQVDPGQGRSWLEFRTFVVKVLLRRSSALENLDKISEALKDIEQVLIFHGDNAEAKKAQHRLKSQVARKEVEGIKEEANALFKDKKVELALQKYDECLKKIQPTDLVPYLGILLNKCACYLFLNQYEEITSICIRGLNLISNHKQKVIAFTDKNERKELNEKLKDYEIRFLVRRGNSYLKTKKFYHAKSDLEEALKLDPQNVQIKQDLNALNQAIAEQ